MWNRKAVVLDLVCDVCGATFQRRLKHHNQKMKRGYRGSVCSRKCSGTFQTRLKMDGLSPFRYIMNSIRSSSRRRGLLISVTPEILRELWHQQAGKCAYSGLAMELLSSGATRPETTVLTASVDRIDSNFGYVVGNVHFVCLFVNLGKSDFSHEAVAGLFSKLRP